MRLNGLLALAALSTVALSSITGINWTPEGLFNGDDGALIQRAYAGLWTDTEGTATTEARFIAALRRDPASPFRWCDLGAALAERGDIEKARLCFARAIELGPTVPAISIRAANFFMQTGHTGEAMRLMAGVLGRTAEYDSVIFGYYRRLGLTTRDVLRDGIPNNRRAVQAYFLSGLLTSDGQQLRNVWNWAASRGFADDGLAKAYLDYLIRTAPEDAIAFWTGYLGPRSEGYGQSNFVFNAGFEADLSGALLDWKLGPPAQAQAVRDRTIVHSGSWSMRIEFHQPGTAISQLVVLGPGTYSLEAWIRTAETSSGTTATLRIRDLQDIGRLNVTTSLAAAPPSWALVTTTFVVESPARPFEITVEAPQPADSSELPGTIWLDDVKLFRQDENVAAH